MLNPMKIKFITVGAYEVNCSVVWGEAKQALIIDPGYDASLIQSCLDANDLTVAAYLLTHGHADHIHALAGLHAARPAPVYLHEADQKWAFGPNNQIPPHYPIPEKPGAEFIDPTDPPRPAGTPPQEGNSGDPLHRRGGRNEVTDGVGSEGWKIADLSFQTLETPGHTPGGVCYWFKEEGVCFTGDTLFKGSCGRTDLPGGDARTLTASLKKLAKLPPETRIIAGHGEETTIAHELKTNFFLQSH
jgi:hydroxyacylglutathione hydrolase